MSKSRCLLIALFAAVAGSAAERPTVRVERHEVLLGSPRSSVIVELAAPNAASRQDLLARLRRDLAPDRAVSQSAAALPVVIRHEYTRAYVGAAVDVTAGGRELLRRLPYVTAVHDDRTVRAYADAPVHDAASRINAGELPTRGKGMVVAVIDSGVDYQHEALGKGLGPRFKVAGGWDFVNNDGDPMDDAGHGTHVAAIIAGHSAELTGVAPEATLLAYKVLGAGGSGRESDVIAAIERALDPNGDGDPSDRVDVMNLSLGGPGTPDDPLAQAVDAAVRAGAVVVVAAGNAGGAMTIGSPGTARLAVTVGASDEYDQVAFFSSKGPTARTFEFKPDLVAPGNMIWSAKRGGGAIQMSGTSMAAPHVAGAAALLKSLNPAWTPAMIKAALTATARPLARSSDPFAHGAGNVDVEAAAAVRVLPQVSGVSFGLNAASTGQWEQSRTFRVTNNSAAAETLALAVDGMAVPGVNVDVSPAQLTLEPGGSGDVTVTARANNAEVEYPFSLSVSGQLRITGTQRTVIPWVFLRAARATVRYPAGNRLIRVQAANHMSQIEATPLSDTELDLILPGDRYDLIAHVVEIDPATEKIRALRYIIRENVTIGGEMSLAFAPEDAVHHFRLAGVDPSGTPLESLERVPERRLHVAEVRLNYTIERDESGLDASDSFGWADGMDVFISSAGPRYQVMMSQLYLDADNMRSYAVSYPVVTGINAGRTLTSDPSRYVRAAVRLRTRDGKPELAGPCMVSSDTRQFGSMVAELPCVNRVVDDGTRFEVWATPDATPNAHHAASVGVGDVRLAPLRAFGNEILPTYERTASAIDVRIPHDGELTIGIGPLHPFGAFGIGSRVFNYVPGPALLGPSGERHEATLEGALFRVFDEAGTNIAGGLVDRFEAAPELKPGYRIEVVYESLLGGARASRGTMQVRLAPGATNLDLTAPAISSLSVRDERGMPSDRLAHGGPATLQLSAGDYTFSIFPRLADGRALKTVRASYRVGAGAWQPVTLSKTGHESTDRHASGHWPAGESYRADLSAMTAAGNDVWVDLRIELEDAAGNTMAWTQERALSIGTPPAPPSAPKRRSIR